MSYHSYRNIGFVFPEAEATCQKWRTKFTGFDASTAVQALNLTMEEEYVLVSYFGEEYRLSTKTGVLEKMTGSDGTPVHWTERLFMNEALVLYHLLGDVAEHPRHAGIWVPEAQLDPVRIRSANRTDPMLTSFAAEFSGQMNQLKAACERFGGAKLEKGDVSYTFSPIPQIALQLVFWDADEDFPAQMQVYVDEFVTDYMHFEAVGCMVADLLEHIGEHKQT